MSKIEYWLSGRSDGEKLALGIVGGLAIVATGGALAYAIATLGRPRSRPGPSGICAPPADGQMVGISTYRCHKSTPTDARCVCEFSMTDHSSCAVSFGDAARDVSR